MSTRLRFRSGVALSLSAATFEPVHSINPNPIAVSTKTQEGCVVFLTELGLLFVVRLRLVAKQSGLVWFAGNL